MSTDMHDNVTVALPDIERVASVPVSQSPDEDWRSALLRLIAEIGRRTAISEISGHHQYDPGKACPGFWVPDWLAAHGLRVGTR